MRTLLLKHDAASVACVVAAWLCVRLCLSDRKKAIWTKAGIMALASWGFFYRDEDRVITNAHRDDLMFSACDGTVLSASDQEVVVFLSPMNMHTQKAPCDGTTVSVVHVDGQFNPAYMLEKTKFNERTITTFSTARGDVQVIQVAGQVARRIVTMVTAGQAVRAGDTFGLIKFGSMVIVRVPAGMRCLTRVGAVVRAAETPIFLCV